MPDQRAGTEPTTRTYTPVREGRTTYSISGVCDRCKVGNHAGCVMPITKEMCCCDE